MLQHLAQTEPHPLRRWLRRSSIPGHLHTDTVQGWRSTCQICVYHRKSRPSDTSHIVVKKMYKPFTPRYQRLFVFDRGHSMPLVRIMVVHVVPAVKVNCQSVQLVVRLDVLGEHLIPSLLCTFVLEYTSFHVVQCQFVTPKLTDGSTFGFPISADFEK